jgi:hypothetical protein
MVEKHWKGGTPKSSLTIRYFWTQTHENKFKIFSKQPYKQWGLDPHSKYYWNSHVCNDTHMT